MASAASSSSAVQATEVKKRKSAKEAADERGILRRAEQLSNKVRLPFLALTHKRGKGKGKSGGGSAKARSRKEMLQTMLDPTCRLVTGITAYARLATKTVQFPNPCVPDKFVQVPLNRVEPIFAKIGITRVNPAIRHMVASMMVKRIQAIGAHIPQLARFHRGAGKTVFDNVALRLLLETAARGHGIMPLPNYSSIQHRKLEEAKKKMAKEKGTKDGDAAASVVQEMEADAAEAQADESLVAE